MPKGCAPDMLKGPQGQKRPADVIGCAVHVAKIATQEIEDSKHDQPNKVRSGLAGSRARAKVLTGERRSEIGRIAAAARWEDK